MARNKGEPFEPTLLDRELVCILLSCGIPHDVVARFVINPATGKKINLKMLQRKFPEEIRTEGKVAIAHLVQRAYARAMSDSDTLMIFLLKCKAGFRQAPEEIHLTQSYAALVEAAAKPKDVPVPAAALKLVGSGKA